MSREIRGIPGSAYVLTPMGYTEAGRLSPGDYAVTESFQPVMITGISEGKGDAELIRTQGSVPILAASGASVLMPDGEAVSVPAVREQREFPWDGIELSDEYHIRRQKRIDTSDRALWFLAGLFFRSGSVTRCYKAGSRRNPYSGISVYAHEAFIPFISEGVGGRFRYNPSRQHDDVYNVCFPGAELAAFCSLFGVTRSERRIPLDAFFVGPELLKAFLSGYLHVEENGIPSSGIVIDDNTAAALSMAHLLEAAYGRPVQFAADPESRAIRLSLLSDEPEADGSFLYPVLGRRAYGVSQSLNLAVEGDEGLIVSRAVFR